MVPFACVQYRPGASRRRGRVPTGSLVQLFRLCTAKVAWLRKQGSDQPVLFPPCLLQQREEFFLICSKGLHELVVPWVSTPKLSFCSFTQETPCSCLCPAFQPPEYLPPFSLVPLCLPGSQQLPKEVP